MTFGEIKELHEMGFTNEQIMALTAGQSQPADSVPEPDGESQPAGDGEHQTEPAEDVPAPTEPKPENTEITAIKDQLAHTQKTLNDLVRQMQKNNLRTASVNLMPDDDLERKTDEAMAELIRPTIEGRDNK